MECDSEARTGCPLRPMVWAAALTSARASRPRDRRPKWVTYCCDVDAATQ